MNSYTIIAVLLILLIISGLMEYIRHIRSVKAIPIRIHVNGTRGKSSVTRLIAAGLNEGGILAFAKTTGTLPRMIMNDGREFPVFRLASPNILEQLRIISFAARNQARALVIECMALHPILQVISETKMIQSTLGVITNTREDHLDIMGPTERDVALAILGTVPYGRPLYTCEKDYPEEFQNACRANKSILITIGDDEINAISAHDLDEFSYLEHKENIALALRVCTDLGIPREKALRGMKKVHPDPGALTDLKVNFFGRTIFFVNGFAANDPESTRHIWKIALHKHQNVAKKIMIINNRMDRPDRSRQLGIALSSWAQPDKYILIGSGSYFLIRYAVKNGVNPGLFINAEGLTTEAIFEEILNFCGSTSLVMGVGNIAGPGLEIIKYFNNRSKDHG